MAKQPPQPPPYNPGAPPPYMASVKAPAQGQTVYIQQQPRSQASQTAATVGGMLGSAFRSGKQLVGGIAKEFVNEVDRYAISPLLDCFKPGSAVQLKNKASNGCVRLHPNGAVDALGIVGEDYAAHFIVLTRSQNIVILRNGAYPNYHLAMLNEVPVGTGIGDRASCFRMHETFDHYLNLEHEMSGKRFGFYTNGGIAPAGVVRTLQDEAKFEVILVYSPYGHIYKAVH